MLESVKEAKIGSIVPIYREINEEINALEYFAKLSDYGNKKNSILIENNETSFGTANPCLMITGKNNDFEIKALNNLGKKFLNFIKKDFKFCDKAIYKKDRIYGSLIPSNKPVSEQEKLRLKTHLDILSTIAFKFEPTTKQFASYSGLFGMISDDFIRTENDHREDTLKDPDYVLYFLDNMFIIDHKTKITYFIANALVTDNQKDKIYHECSKTINSYENLISKKVPKGKKPKKKELNLSNDISKEELLKNMKFLKKQIINGEILSATSSRTTVTTYNSEPLDIYAQIKIAADNKFYINDATGTIIGSDEKVNLVVDSRRIKLKILTTERHRGIVKDEIEKDLDNKYEALLKVDENEIAYNIMLIDGARNDLAQVSEPGTRHVDEMLVVNEQDKFQNISFTLKGILREDLNVLHAYSAIMSPDVTGGMPKLKSLQLLRNIDKNKKGFNSGSVLHLAPDKTLQNYSTELIRIKKDKAYITTNFRVFNNSNNKEEFKTNNKENLLDAIKSAWGLK